MFDFQRIKTDVLALGLLALAVFVGLSLASFDPADPPSTTVFPLRTAAINICGSAGAAVAWYARYFFGIGAWLAFAALVAWDVSLFSKKPKKSVVRCLAGMLLLVLPACAAMHFLAPQAASGAGTGVGGVVGAYSGLLAAEHLTTTGITLVLVSTFIAGWLLSPLSDYMGGGLKLATVPVAIGSLAASALRRKQPVAVETDVPEDVEADDPVLRIAEITDDPPEVDDEVGDTDGAGEEFEDVDELPTLRINHPHPVPAAPAPNETERLTYELPDISLLEEPEEFPFEMLAKKARIAAATLEKTFQEFGLNVRVSEVDTGPAITQFELELEPGLRLNKVTALADDIAIALRVPAVRVVAPIPGKNTVGVEVPNEKRVTVRLRELIEADTECRDHMRIPIYLGKDVSGKPLTVDMTKMPHLLIAGRTGTGKSVCLNTLILSILMTRKPDDVRMLMIDPKMVELSPYKSVPHLMHPVITDMKKAEAVLAWAVDKMEERYDLLAQVGVRHLDSYNKLGHARVLERLGMDVDDPDAGSVPAKMPYIVIIADEMADLIMTAGKEVQAHIIRLAQKSRAVGIHLVLATQKPTVDVITGLIKSNLPARISFQVASGMDSRVVLDENGAERLLGNGDMLYLAPGTSNLTRAQGTYVSDDEINSVIDFYSDCEPQYSEELKSVTSSGNTGGRGGEPDIARPHDDLYNDAIEVVIREGRGSCSLLQRCLGIGYGRASRMIDWMAADGIVGDHNGSSAREVLYTLEQWHEENAVEA